MSLCPQNGHMMEPDPAVGLVRTLTGMPQPAQTAVVDLNFIVYATPQWQPKLIGN
jgi:hypothetical protein